MEDPSLGQSGAVVRRGLIRSAGFTADPIENRMIFKTDSVPRDFPGLVKFDNRSPSRSHGALGRLRLPKARRIDHQGRLGARNRQYDAIKQVRSQDRNTRFLRTCLSAEHPSSLVLLDLLDRRLVADL